MVFRSLVALMFRDDFFSMKKQDFTKITNANNVKFYFSSYSVRGYISTVTDIRAPTATIT
jgi:hypothetical protein